MIVARKGEEVRRPDGALYATLNRDVHFGEITRRDSFDFADSVPDAGEPIPDFMVAWFYAVADRAQGIV